MNKASPPTELVPMVGGLGGKMDDGLSQMQMQLPQMGAQDPEWTGTVNLFEKVN